MIEILLSAAVSARANAYAPYSRYTVGAAVLDASGNIWTGCNVENVSYGLSICGERTAICKMVSEGHREIKAVAIATKDGGTPCGMCLQTLLEFAPDPRDVEVHTVSENGSQLRFLLSELIPFGFNSSELRRT